MEKKNWIKKETCFLEEREKEFYSRITLSLLLTVIMFYEVITPFLLWVWHACSCRTTNTAMCYSVSQLVCSIYIVPTYMLLFQNNGKRTTGEFLVFPFFTYFFFLFCPRKNPVKWEDNGSTTTTWKQLINASQPALFCESIDIYGWPSY